jgi:hypothetical protein
LKTLISKSEYAKPGRGPSAVSNWLAEAKISLSAIEGTGRFAKIWVEKADADLARNLDPIRQAVQEVPIGDAADPKPEIASEEPSLLLADGGRRPAPPPQG